MTAPHEIITGPAGDQFPAFAADQFTHLRGLQQHGDIVGVDLGGIPTAVLYDLAAIHTVFSDRLEHIGMPLAFRRLAHVTGHGLLTNYDWDSWYPRRRRVQKRLSVRSLAELRDRMTTIIDDELDAWPVGEPFELHDRVKRLTLRVVADLLFTTDLTGDAISTIDRAVEEIHAWAESDPENADTEHEPASFTAATTALDDLIRTIVARRDPHDPGDDMVGVLVAATCEDDAPLDLEGVRDEAVTLILAGHETVTNTICFYPPVHMTTKAVVRDLDLGDVTVPAGWEVLVPELVIYRDPQYFERPDEFLPERWAEGSPIRAERRAYFPFLTGPKFCVGSHFALLEATEAIARFRARYRHRMLDDSTPWGREFALSFAPDRPMPIVLEAR
jgi:cytochrome P450